MKKLINVKTGKEVFFGETITHEIREDNEYFCITATLTPKTLEYFINTGIIETRKEITFSDVIDSLKARWGVTVAGLDNILRTLEKGNTGALLNIYLREVALMLDDEYEDHISKAENLFVIDATNGAIRRLPKDNIITYNTFAAFRTLEDAKYACKILKPVFKDIYGKKK